jgi:hypothetical protein
MSMTPHVPENHVATPALAVNVRAPPGRFARAIDAIVSAKAARSVPECQMKKVRGDINRHLGHIRAGERRIRTKQRPRPACAALPESAICNFSR